MFPLSQYKLTLMRSSGNKKVQINLDNKPSLYADKNEEFKLKKFENIISHEKKRDEKAKKIVSKIKFD